MLPELRVAVDDAGCRDSGWTSGLVVVERQRASRDPSPHAPNPPRDGVRDGRERCEVLVQGFIVPRQIHRKAISGEGEMPMLSATL